MRDFWVIWTYIGNFSKLQKVQANNPADALERVTGFFGSDFRKRGSVYVFDKEPVISVEPKKEGE